MDKTMKKTICFLAFLWAICFHAMAGVWSPSTIKIPYLEEEKLHTCNPDSILSVQAVDSINRMLTYLQQLKGIQAIVVVVDHLEGDDPYTFNRDLFQKYGIGQKDKDNGLIITMAKGDRSFQISPGVGLEKILPDIVCNRIENRVMVPHLKKEEWDDAMTGTVNTVLGLLSGDDETQKAIGSFLSEEDQLQEGKKGSIWDVLWKLMAVFGVGFAAFKGIQYKNTHRACPHCGEKNAQKRVSRLFEDVTDGRMAKETWTCLKCGKTDLVERFIPASTNDDDSSNKKKEDKPRRQAPPPKTGGSFGGGNYGGGGAGGRF